MEKTRKDDMEYLKERLEALGEPELPASLTAAALFERLDRGELALPEEDARTEAPEEKVIPWQRLVRRGLPLAACLALVALVWQGLGGAVTGSDMVASGAASSSAAAQMAPFAADSAAPKERAAEPEEEAGAAPEMAAAPAPENGIVTESAQDAAPAPDGLLAALPEEDELTNPDTAGGEAPQKENPATGGGGESFDEDDPLTGGGGASFGEAEEMTPDTGGPVGGAAPDLSGEAPAESVGPSAAWDRAAEEQILSAAGEKAPEGLVPELSWWWRPDGGTVEARVIYRDAAGEKAEAAILTFQAEGEGEDPGLTLISIAPEEAAAKPGPSAGRTGPDPGLGG